MTQLLIVFFSVISTFISISSCNSNENIVLPISNMENNRLKIEIGSSTFYATLLDNSTVTAFKARLPLTVTMSELNGNEKLYRFPNNLPVNASNPGTISTGDLMIYGANTLVIFYKSFPTSYSYTSLGRIDNTSGLVAAVGSGSVEVSFELE